MMESLSENRILPGLDKLNVIASEAKQSPVEIEIASSLCSSQ